MKEESKWAHFVAVGGTAMGALAAMQKDCGYFVSGSDGPLYPPMSDFLEVKGIPIRDYAATNLKGSTWGIAKKHPDVIVIGNAISRSHPEALMAEELSEGGQSRRVSFAQTLGEMAIGDKQSFVLCGTHGKSSSTTLLAHAFESLGLNPGFFVGAIPGNFGQGYRLGSGKVFVSEGDEYDTAYWDKESKFLHYRPAWVICTGVEFDHADIFSSVEDIENSFLKLVDRCQTGWVMVDEKSAPRLESVKKIRSKVLGRGLGFFSYGRQDDSDIYLMAVSPVTLPWNPKVMGSKIKFFVKAWQKTCEVISPLSGEHNALNLCGIVCVLLKSGYLQDVSVIQTFLEDYKGLKRRQEELYHGDDLVVIDDFAHHPTAITMTISAIKEKYPGFLVGAFFEPRSATSARSYFSEAFKKCFLEADALFLSPPTKANIPENEKLDIEDVVLGIKTNKPQMPVVVEKDVDQLANAFWNWKNKVGRAVALVMSNGSFGGLHKKIMVKAKPQHSRGQASVEYLLLLVVLVTVVLGVLAPAITKYIQSTKDKLASSVQDVISQRELGIPLEWFGGASLTGANRDGSGRDLRDLNGDDPDQNGLTDDERGTSSFDDGDSAGGAGAGADPRFAGGEGGNGLKGDLDGDGVLSPEEQEILKDQDQVGAGSLNGSGGSRRGGGRSTSASGTKDIAENARDLKKNDEEGVGGAAKDSKASEESETATVVGRAKQIAKQNQVAESSCENIDLFTILKFGAIIGLVILIVGVAINKKGNQTSDPT